MKNIYATKDSTEIIEYSNGEIHLAANTYGKGHTVYIAGLPYNKVNTRLLIRSLYYAAGKEKKLYPQVTKVYDGFGNANIVNLAPCEILWELY